MDEMSLSLTKRKDSISVSSNTHAHTQFLNPFAHNRGGSARRVKRTGAESARLSGLMMQSARNTPGQPPPPFACPLQRWHHLSLEAAWQRNSRRAARGRGTFFPTAVSCHRGNTAEAVCFQCDWVRVMEVSAEIKETLQKSLVRALLAFYAV